MRCSLAGSNEGESGAVNGDNEQLIGDGDLERPRWMNEQLVKEIVSHFESKSSGSFGEPEAVQLLISLNQLLEATGKLKLEIDDEEELHRLGKGE